MDLWQSYFRADSTNRRFFLISSREKATSDRFSNAWKRGLSEGLSARYTSRALLSGAPTTVLFRCSNNLLYSASVMVCWDLVLRALGPLLMDGTTASIMAINVVHCSGEKTPSAGGSGKGDTRGTKTGWVEPMMLMMAVEGVSVFGFGGSIRGIRAIAREG